MLSETTIKIIRDVSQIISDAGGECSEWFVGVTADVELRLLRDKGIRPEDRWQICRCAVSAAEARAIVLGFRNLSCMEALDPNDTGAADSVYVFAYRKRRTLAASPCCGQP